MSPKSRWLEGLKAYTSPAALALLLLGFASGLPVTLVISTLSYWLNEAGVAKETIGYASLIALAYSFKWVWAPFLDQVKLPLLHKLGRRRSWLVFSQVLIALGLAIMAFCNPQTSLATLIAVGVLVAFASATQDVAIDAYRLEIAQDTHQATLAASYMAGYRIAELLATAGVLYLVSWLGSSGLNYIHSAWASSYLLFGILMVPGILTTLWIKEPLNIAMSKVLPYSFWQQAASALTLVALLISVPAMFTQFFYTDFARVFVGNDSLLDLLIDDRAFLRALLYTIITAFCVTNILRGTLKPVLLPLEDFITRFRWQALILLGIVATYRMADVMVAVMSNVFFSDMGFTSTQIANVTKVFGLFLTLFGAGAGGLLIVRFGILPILFIGGVLTAVTNLLFVLLAQMGANMTMLVIAVSGDNFTRGLAAASLVAFLSSLSNLKFSAVQYALLSSLMALLPRLVGGSWGKIVAVVGYETYFVIAALLGIPTLIFIAWQWSIEQSKKKYIEK
ncbi:MFS transporter [Pseudomonas sp. F1_0610]|uniref:AmpG family muropeptide MFS transporter n=1 Tax=Pseudomonas sp. F1_0610 TaxID=3114284 RepID=UPI0039C4A6F1